MSVTLVNQQLFNEVAALAAQSPRRRKNYNFHSDDADPCHRLLNAMEPDSYIPPHRHCDAGKEESIIIMRGAVGVIFFDEAGEVTQKVVLQAGGETLAVNIPPGRFHTLVAFEPSVFFESKAGPYLPLTAEEKALWAPQEGEPAAASRLAQYRAMFNPL